MNHTRERHHVRRGTVTVNENPLGSEVANLLNEIADTNPDDLLVAVQRKMTQYLTDKEKHWKEEAIKVCVHIFLNLRLKYLQLKWTVFMVFLYPIF